MSPRTVKGLLQELSEYVRGPSRSCESILRSGFWARSYMVSRRQWSSTGKITVVIFPREVVQVSESQQECCVRSKLAVTDKN